MQIVDKLEYDSVAGSSSIAKGILFGDLASVVTT